MPVKTILYLDQNYVSHLTKARLGVKVNLAAYYENLYDALREAVRENAVVCPTSQYHYGESDLDTRLAPEIYRTLDELSCAVEFRGFVDVIQAQTVSALCSYLGESRQQGFLWMQAFRTDPHGPFDAIQHPIRRKVPREFSDFARVTKAMYKRRPDLTRARTLERQKLSEAQRFIYDAYLQPYVDLGRGYTGANTVAALGFLDDLFLVYSDLLGRPPAVEEITAFLQSEQMMAAPFIDVYSSLRAAMLLDRDRKPKGSDLPDVLIAATVLPYCDVFATDGHVKQLILALKLQERYEVTVFGSRKADVLALTALVRDLPGAEGLPSPPVLPAP